MAEALADLIQKVQAASEQAAQQRNEREIAERLAPICNAEPLTQDEMALCKEFMEWARRKEVKYFPAKPSTVALWVADHSGHKSESDLLAMLEAIKRMHDAHGGLANPCSTCAVERMLAVVIKAEPPRSWPKAEKALFATLDPALRAIISKRESERERGLRQKQNELSAAIKAAEQRQSDGAETKPVNSKKENENGKEART